MCKTDWVVRTTHLVIAVMLIIIAVQLFLRTEVKASADSARFDHVTIVAPTFLYRGAPGVLLMDRRNGNVWFIPKGNDMAVSYLDPVFVVRLPLEKLDQAQR